MISNTSYSNGGLGGKIIAPSCKPCPSHTLWIFQPQNSTAHTFSKLPLCLPWRHDGFVGKPWTYLDQTRQHCSVCIILLHTACSVLHYPHCARSVTPSSIYPQPLRPSLHTRNPFHRSFSSLSTLRSSFVLLDFFVSFFFLPLFTHADVAVGVLVCAFSLRTPFHRVCVFLPLQN